jgi:hypothetical protein
MVDESMSMLRQPAHAGRHARYLSVIDSGSAAYSWR